MPQLHFLAGFQSGIENAQRDQALQIQQAETQSRVQYQQQELQLRQQQQQQDRNEWDFKIGEIQKKQAESAAHDAAANDIYNGVPMVDAIKKIGAALPHADTNTILGIGASAFQTAHSMQQADAAKEADITYKIARGQAATDNAQTNRDTLDFKQASFEERQKFLKETNALNNEVKLHIASMKGGKKGPIDPVQASAKVEEMLNSAEPGSWDPSMVVPAKFEMQNSGTLSVTTLNRLFHNNDFAVKKMQVGVLNSDIGRAESLIKNPNFKFMDTEDANKITGSVTDLTKQRDDLIKGMVGKKVQTAPAAAPAAKPAVPDATVMEWIKSGVPDDEIKRRLGEQP